MDKSLKGDSTILRYEGVFDWEGLYSMITRWFYERNFDFEEKMYKDKTPEIEVKWEFERKASGYVKYVINIEFHFWDFQKVEVMKDGKKKKMDKAKLQMTLTPSILTDYEKNFEKSSFTKKLENLLNKTILKIYLLTQIAKVIDLTYEVHRLTKENLNLMTKYSGYK